MKEKSVFLFIILINAFIHTYSQYQVDSVRAVSNLLEFDLGTIDSLNIKKLKLTTYLTEEEKKEKGLNQNIYSEVSEYHYKKNKLIKDSRYYSGIDSEGKDHFTKNPAGFNTYSMIFENYYVYDKNDSLVRVDQNTLFRNKTEYFLDLKEITPEQFIIDKIPVNQYIQVNFNTETDAILWQITKNRYLYCKIIE